MPAPESIISLVKQFKDDYESLTHEKEATIRREFIDKFFAALGWDMENKGGSRSLYRDVIVEDTLQSEEGTSTWAPDYSFGIGGDRKFFVEAKSISAHITADKKAWLQARRYAWNAKLPICILTNFEDFIALDARREPKINDHPKSFIRLHVNHERYVDRWEEISEQFSWLAVSNGSIERWVRRLEEKEPAGVEVDERFLETVEDWRKELAIRIHEKHPKLPIVKLKYAVTRIIDRIIFLRVCEARGQIIGKDRLLPRVRGENAYQELVKCFNDADARYNSGLFHFNKKDERIEPPDEITPSLKVSPDLTSRIIKELYDGTDLTPTPYDFHAMPVEVLGQMYEQFLGKTIEIDASGVVAIVSKGEDRQARRRQGIYYTPSFVVRYIVKKVLTPLLDGKTPETLGTLRVLDPACGSGSFLLGAYQYLLGWYHDYYDDLYKKTGVLTNLRKADSGTTELVLEERNRILLEHIFGVDLDPQAVEVAKLSLLLEAVKDEPKSVLDTRTRRAKPALPDLGNNIKCGNSLLGADFPPTKGETKVDRERINRFNWQERFSEVLGEVEFDAVIGNPPYVRQETLGSEFKDYVKEKYKDVYHGVADLYVYFFQCAHKLLKPGGYFGMICSNKWMRANYGKPLRQYLTKNTTLREIIDFGELRVFKDAATFPAIVITQKRLSTKQQFTYVAVKRLDFPSLEKEVQKTGAELDERAVAGGNWALTTAGEIDIFEKMKQQSVPLGKYVDGGIHYGIKTGDNEAFFIDRATRRDLIAKDKRSREIIKLFVVGDDIRKYNIRNLDRYLIFTRHGTDIENYPAIKKHLSKFRTQLMPRPEDWNGEGEWPGRKPGPYKWYEIQDNVAYYELFEQPKIIYPVIAREPRFTFDTSGLYCNDKAFIIPTNDLYLLGLLNSKLIWAYLKRLCSVLGDADKGGRLELRRVHIVDLPIRRIDSKNKSDKAKHKKLVSLVEEILEGNKELVAEDWAHNKERIQGEIASLDEQINQLVYELYDLTPEEIAIVEGSADSGRVAKT